MIENSFSLSFCCLYLNIYDSGKYSRICLKHSIILINFSVKNKRRSVIWVGECSRDNLAKDVVITNIDLPSNNNDGTFLIKRANWFNHVQACWFMNSYFLRFFTCLRQVTSESSGLCTANLCCNIWRVWEWCTHTVTFVLNYLSTEILISKFIANF